MKKLTNSKLELSDDSEEIDPLSGIVNLADVMLVFACGLMVALVLNWNVDISGTSKEINIEESQSVDESDILDQDKDLNIKDGNSFEEMGKVYKDESTGKLYIIPVEE